MRLGFPEPRVERRNLLVLRPDPHLRRVEVSGAAPLAQIYVDLWQIGGSEADRHLLELEKRLEAQPTEALKILARKSPDF